MQITVTRLAAFFESRVTDGEDFVEDQDVPNRAKRHGVRQSRRHPARVMTKLQVRKLLELGKFEDLRRGRSQLFQGHPHDGPEELDIVDRIQIRVPSDAKLEDRCDRGAHQDSPRVRRVNPRDDLEKRALARAVTPHQAEALTGPKLEAD